MMTELENDVTVRMLRRIIDLEEAVQDMHYRLKAHDELIRKNKEDIQWIMPIVSKSNT